MQTYVPLVKQNVMKLDVFILGGQRIDQKRRKGRWRGRRERIEKGSRERIEIERKETKGTELEEYKEHRHLPLLVVLLRQGTAFLLSSRLDSAVKRCSSESPQSGLVKGLARRD